VFANNESFVIEAKSWFFDARGVGGKKSNAPNINISALINTNVFKINLFIV